MSQLTKLEAERDKALQANQAASEGATQRSTAVSASTGDVGAQLLRLRGIGPEFASVLSWEAFYLTLPELLPQHHAAVDL